MLLQVSVSLKNNNCLELVSKLVSLSTLKKIIKHIYYFQTGKPKTDQSRPIHLRRQPLNNVPYHEVISTLFIALFCNEHVVFPSRHVDSYCHGSSSSKWWRYATAF